MSYMDMQREREMRIRRRRRRNWIIGTTTSAATIAAIVATWLFGTDTWHVTERSFYNGFWRAWLFPAGWNLFLATPGFWVVVLTAVLIGIYVKLSRTNTYWPTWYKWTVSVTCVLGLVFVSVSGFRWGEIGARYFNADASYVVSDPSNVPNTLARVASSSTSQVKIVKGDMPDAWVPRVASATGATYVMQKTGDSNANTTLLDETITYIYGDGDQGEWTAIRNGKGRQPIFGVATWSGTGTTVKTCEFKGQYALNRTFGGSWGRNLDDEIAQANPLFTYAMNDVWGYCNGDQPIIVIPGTRTSHIENRTVLESYGVMTVTGSSSGNPVIKFYIDVKPGQFPGPVYPVQLVQKQREALGWSAGRVWFWQPPTGFSATDTTAQSENNADFLLKSKADGRLYWVTPMKPSNTDSQTLVAYSVTPADELTEGRLNQQRVYVLNDGDSRIVNLNDLENAVTQAVAAADPGFFTGAENNQGHIVEFVPTSDATWQVFAERGGRAVYRIDVSGGARLSTSVVNLDNSGVTNQPTGSNAGTDCGGDIASLSEQQLVTCAKSFMDELATRQAAKQ